VSIALLLILSGCASSGISHLPPPRMSASAPVVETLRSPPATAVPPDRQEGRSAVAARVGGREITLDDVAREMFRSAAQANLTDRQRALGTLNKLVIREIVEQEKKRLGLEVPADWLAAEKQRAHEDLKLQVATTYGVSTTPERYLQSQLKQSFPDYLARKEAEAAERWVLSRIIRFHGIESDRVELQLIALDDEKTAREVAAKLDQGADFTQLAMTYSKHPSGQSGGRLPPLARESLNPAVADRAFALAPGARSNILSVDDGLGRRQLEIVKLLRRIPGRRVTWAEVAAEVEDGLKKEPVGPDEFVAWSLRLERLYDVWVDEKL
jgi:foldase protein PrsA